MEENKIDKKKSLSQNVFPQTDRGGWRWQEKQDNHPVGQSNGLPEIGINKQRGMIASEVRVTVLGRSYAAKNVPLYFALNDELRQKYAPRPASAKKIQTRNWASLQPVKAAAESINENLRQSFRRSLFSFATLSCVILSVFGVITFISRGYKVKDEVLVASAEGYDYLLSAVESAKEKDFQKSSADFKVASQYFEKASGELDSLGSLLVDYSKFIPGASKLASGKSATEAGKNISRVGSSISEVSHFLLSLQNEEARKGKTVMEIYQFVEKGLLSANTELSALEKNLSLISIDDLPQEKRTKFLVLKNKLPEINENFAIFAKNSAVMADILGGNGPRRYLFLFQNNHEMRATGGFIGSYGYLDIAEGKIRKFYIDGIFNPDGQLKENIVPPKPIQKISGAWSLHDSNWFPDFPLSAEKAILFYEKTGGPTVDGVITITPEVLKKLLEITGPIDMIEYGATIDAENFVEVMQYEVEMDYDKEENNPKKIISDLVPILFEKILTIREGSQAGRIASALLASLDQKHVLIYSKNKDLQALVAAQGWSGEMRSTENDYLSVINSNINGYKTDGVIEQKISHVAEIDNDGTVIDSVIITRKHTGGNTAYEWWNKVNANYMRVYVPLGAKLLAVEGQTKEVNEPPLDYVSLGFARDPDLEKEEENTVIDANSGTRIYTESGKTVFANWVYVSPQETVVIKYRYQLPKKIDLANITGSDAYSLLLQKQAGSVADDFSAEVRYPANWQVRWSYPENITRVDTQLKIEDKLRIDKFLGVVFTKK